MYKYVGCTSGNPGPPFNGFVRHCVQLLKLGLGKCVHSEQKSLGGEEILRINPKLVLGTILASWTVNQIQKIMNSNIHKI